MREENYKERHHVLIVGTGSVGKRHAENLYNIGCSVSCVDPRIDRLKELESRLPVIETYTDLEEAISRDCQYDGVVICSPPKWHVEQAVKALKNKIPILLEKPVCKDLNSALVLQNLVRNVNYPNAPDLLLGYTWRWWPALRHLRSLVKRNSIGQILSARIHVSAHLEDWHPWERYQDFFMSSDELGGGALLDESHWLDQMIWLFGMPYRVIGTIDKVSDLEITSDDSVDLLCFYKQGLKVSIHMDIYGRPHEKSISLIGSGGTVSWDEKSNSVTTQRKNGIEETNTFANSRNDMFVGVAAEFVDVMAGAQPTTCQIEDGIKVLQIIEGVRTSSRLKKVVDLVDLVQ